MSEKIKWGFDLTGFKSDKHFKSMIKKHKLKGGRRVCESEIEGIPPVCYYVWKSKKLRLITANNPITGKYNYPTQREPEKGYASYIGIEGKTKAVKSLVKDIKKNTSWIKAESKYKRGFI